jgi:hypothetical protein
MEGGYNGLVKTKFERNVSEWFGKGEKAEAILKLASMKEDEFRSMNVDDLVDKFADEQVKL